MKELRYTLLTDGSSDKALLPILTWLLHHYLENTAIQSEWADLRLVRDPLIDTFPKRIQQSLALYPCDLLFIHRDAEKETIEKREAEIQDECIPALHASV